MNDIDAAPSPILLGLDRVPAVHPWPEGTTVRAGRARFGPTQERGWFVEVMPAQPWYFRAHAATIPAAEDACWERFEAALACPGHQWWAGRHTNGSGTCELCGVFCVEAFTGAQLGQFCTVCSAATLHASYSPCAVWDERGWVEDPSAQADRLWYCAEHDPFAARRAAHWDAEEAAEEAQDAARTARA